MFKMTQTYQNYDGIEETGTFYFNLNKVEVLEMEAEANGGYRDMLKKVVETRDAKKIMELFKTLLLKSYGIKSEDGKRFIKSPEITEQFQQSAAYPEIFMTLCTDAKKAADFVSYVMPLDDEQRKSIKSQADKEMKEVATDGNVTPLPENT